MAYDKVKAHEYYMNYRKKGLLKGRKKGKGKTKGTGKGKAKSATLTGVSSSGLTDAGKLEADLIKNRVGKEMQAALANAKTDEDKIRIKHAYQQKAKAEIENLKKDPKYGVQKAAKGSSGGSSKSSGGSSGGKSSGSGSSGGGSKGSGGGTKTTVTTVQDQAATRLQKSLDTLSSILDDLPDKIGKLSDIQKAEVKTLVSDIMAELSKQSGINAEDVKKKLKDKGLTV